MLAFEVDATDIICGSGSASTQMGFSLESNNGYSTETARPSATIWGNNSSSSSGSGNSGGYTGIFGD